MIKTVSKFGGSSVKNVESINRSMALALTQKSSIIFVSATLGTTNQIEKIADYAVNSTIKKAEIQIKQMKEKHLEIAKGLKANQEEISQIQTITEEIKAIAKGMNLLKECTLKAMDNLYSTGERLSSILCYRSLSNQIPHQSEAVLFDIRKIMKTNDNYGKAIPDIQKIKELSNIELSLSSNKIYITQGFIGSTEEGYTTTLGRGGSDYSAALIAEAINADKLEIWTDVAGISTTDPRICKTTKPIKEITFQEAAELANFGAKVLHPTTIDPARRLGIPLFVGSSIKPEEDGTWIKKETITQPLVRAMALRRKQTLITVSTPEMLNTHGFLYLIFKIFNDHKVSVDSITTSEISIAITINGIVNKKMVKELEKVAKVKIEENLALISLIGNQVNTTPNLARDIFSAIEGINVRMICQGASKHNFCFLIKDDSCEKAINSLHKNLMENV